MATIQGVYVALFGRPADPTGLNFFNAATNNGADLSAIGDLASTQEYQDRFSGQSNARIITSIYQSLFDRNPEQAGLDFFLAALANGAFNINNIAIAILDGATGTDLELVNKKIAAADLFTAAIDTPDEIASYQGTTDAQQGIDFLEAVTATSDVVDSTGADLAVADLPPPGTGVPRAMFTLTAGADQADTTGSAKNGGLISSDFQFTTANELVTAVSGTLGANDVLADWSTNDSDTLNATLTGGELVGSSVSNIENINLIINTANSGLTMTGVTGSTAISVTGTASGELDNLDSATAPSVALRDYNSTLKVDFDEVSGTTGAGTGEAFSVEVNGTGSSATLDLNSNNAGGETLETLNIASSGASANNLTLTTVGAGSNALAGIAAHVVTGSADLTINAAFGLLNGVSISGDHSGVLTIGTNINGANGVAGLNAENFANGDAYVITDSTLGADAFGLFNIVNNSTVTVADDIGLAGSIITVREPGGTDDAVTVVLDNDASTDADLDMTGTLTIDNVETITINSTGAPTTGAAADQQNIIGDLTIDNVETLNIIGDSDFTTDLTAGSIAAGDGGNISIDGSTATGKIDFDLGDLANTASGTREVGLSGGGDDDILTGSTDTDVQVIFTGNAGDDRFNISVAEGNDIITDFTNGDILALGAGTAAGTFINGLDSAVITAVEQTKIEAAANLNAAAAAAVAAATGVDTSAILFSYQGNHYIAMVETTADFGADDAVVAVSGLSSSTTFDAGTFLFA